MLANLTFALKISSFTCKNVQTSHDELHNLCEVLDIICLQGTWFAKIKLSKLSNTHMDFNDNDIYSMDDENHIVEVVKPV